MQPMYASGCHPEAPLRRESPSSRPLNLYGAEREHRERWCPMRDTCPELCEEREAGGDGAQSREAGGELCPSLLPCQPIAMHGAQDPGRVLRTARSPDAPSSRDASARRGNAPCAIRRAASPRAPDGPQFQTACKALPIAAGCPAALPGSTPCTASSDRRLLVRAPRHLLASSHPRQSSILAREAWERDQGNGESIVRQARSASAGSTRPFSKLTEVAGVHFRVWISSLAYCLSVPAPACSDGAAASSAQFSAQHPSNILGDQPPVHTPGSEKPPRGGPAAPDSSTCIAHTNVFLPPAARSTSPSRSTRWAATPSPRREEDSAPCAQTLHGSLCNGRRSGSRAGARSRRSSLRHPGQLSLVVAAAAAVALTAAGIDARRHRGSLAHAASFPSDLCVLYIPSSFTCGVEVEILCTFAVAVGAAKPLQPRSHLSSCICRAAFYFFPPRGRCTSRRRCRLVSSSGAEHISAAGLFSPAAGKVCVAVPFFFRLRRTCHPFRLALALIRVQAPHTVSAPALPRFFFCLRRAINPHLRRRFRKFSSACGVPSFSTLDFFSRLRPRSMAAFSTFFCLRRAHLGKRVKTGAVSQPAARM
ncbi:hypothetical protein AURDEDRAFT_177720 [Auricularia subglabra TFB-10046 SS5]|uniref:Uncharacterized protein n=1 Tax=Auricularia subglabra (strain TFB-10046 / SS5) TaxID=717982 RepID=J0D3D8_AURST|nr:hypothetical protein AURDEDRAFT_177720 [Auricularia subglabra TFB-10046 SS5]